MDMSRKEKCELILTKMRDAGHDGIVPNAEGWSDGYMIYFLANYEEHYLEQKESQ